MSLQTIQRKTYITWGIMTGLLVMLHVFLVYVSSDFIYGRDTLDKPIFLFVSVEIAACVLYLLMVRKFIVFTDSRLLISVVIIVGFLLRFLMFGSTPVLENDFYRYLWDGAVAAHGINPYAYSPDDVLYADDSTEALPPLLTELGEQSTHVLKRINYPHLRTIYPPVAQAAFSAAYLFSPLSLTSWRFILLISETASLMLMLIILRKMSLPLIHLVIYWWNPLVIKEVFNSGHMDALIVPFIIGSFLLAIYKRYNSAALLLALAFGVKIWPAMLLLLILRPLFKNPVRLIKPSAVFGLTAAVMLIPIYLADSGESSGFVRYSRVWEMNDTAYMLFLWFVRYCLRIGEKAHLVTRGLIIIILAVGLGIVAKKDIMNNNDFFKRSLLVVAALFLVSPTQFPWYYIWILPFLVVAPVIPLLVLTPLLQLYYLRFYFSARGIVNIFDYGIVWIEFVPVWILIIREWIVQKRISRIPDSETA